MTASYCKLFFLPETESTLGAETVAEIGQDLALGQDQGHESVVIETKMINTKVVNQGNYRLCNVNCRCHRSGCLLN